MARRGRGFVALAWVGLAVGCGNDVDPAPLAAPSSTAAASITGSTESDVPATAAPTPAPVPSATSTIRLAPAVPATTATTARSRVRAVVSSGWAPFASVGGVTLTHPADRVERVGFHESSHDGARQMEPTATAVAPVTVESRQRGTGARTAADIVVDPAGEIRSPVTGRVKRAGGYVLYCKHSDDFVVIEPDSRPGWEVKVLHISGERVSAGQRVIAGQTVLAPRATQLPFASQVDELRTADPAWPHVHVEVVDPTIPDRPSPGGGCS